MNRRRAIEQSRNTRRPGDRSSLASPRAGPRREESKASGSGHSHFLARAGITSRSASARAAILLLGTSWSAEHSHSALTAVRS